jgi:hypothetical protein
MTESTHTLQYGECFYVLMGSEHDLLESRFR